MTGSTADRRLNSRLICSVTRRFWPELKTLNLDTSNYHISDSI